MKGYMYQKVLIQFFVKDTVDVRMLPDQWLIECKNDLQILMITGYGPLKNFSEPSLIQNNRHLPQAIHATVSVHGTFADAHNS